MLLEECIFKIRRDCSCQTENLIYTSTLEVTPRNYKSHIKNNVNSCESLDTWIYECKRVSNLSFIIVNVLNNVDHFSADETEDLLLQKEQFSIGIGTPVTQHWGSNGNHHWKRAKRSQLSQLLPNK